MAFLSCIHFSGADGSRTQPGPGSAIRKYLPAGVGLTGNSQLSRLVSSSGQVAMEHEGKLRHLEVSFEESRLNSGREMARKDQHRG